MKRRAARALHLALFLTGVVLYVVFVIPRWWVLTGDIPSTLATAGRIAAGIPIAAAAWPVMQILQTALRSKPRTPELALRLRAWSAVLHVVAGVLILLTAIAEIWLSLETGGPWLFAVYGAAGAIAVLAFLGLYLSFVAEQPPAGPRPAKPVKAKKVKTAKAKPEKKPRGKKRGTAAEASAPATTADDAETTAVVADVESITVTEPVTEPADETPDTTAVVVTESVVAESPAEPAEESPSSTGSLRNKRPAGKSRRRLSR